MSNRVSGRLYGSSVSHELARTWNLRFLKGKVATSTSVSNNQQNIFDFKGFV